ncbi:WG repeat-containing protein [Actinoplanes sp. NPDC049802]|uniref:WG repeat-containing protein n=1 Tax=Actinoplanes sp. NPDC049802 TaxID=3154742 RepID=UPI0033D2B195
MDHTQAVGPRAQAEDHTRTAGPRTQADDATRTTDPRAVVGEDRTQTIDPRAVAAYLASGQAAEPGAETAAGGPRHGVEAVQAQAGRHSAAIDPRHAAPTDMMGEHPAESGHDAAAGQPFAAEPAIAPVAGGPGGSEPAGEEPETHGLGWLLSMSGLGAPTRVPLSDPEPAAPVEEAADPNRPLGWFAPGGADDAVPEHAPASSEESPDGTAEAADTPVTPEPATAHLVDAEHTTATVETPSHSGADDAPTTVERPYADQLTDTGEPEGAPDHTDGSPAETAGTTTAPHAEDVPGNAAATVERLYADYLTDTGEVAESEAYVDMEDAAGNSHTDTDDAADATERHHADTDEGEDAPDAAERPNADDLTGRDATAEYTPIRGTPDSTHSHAGTTSTPEPTGEGATTEHRHGDTAEAETAEASDDTEDAPDAAERPNADDLTGRDATAEYTPIRETPDSTHSHAGTTSTPEPAGEDDTSNPHTDTDDTADATERLYAGHLTSTAEAEAAEGAGGSSAGVHDAPERALLTDADDASGNAGEFADAETSAAVDEYGQVPGRADEPIPVGIAADGDAVAGHSPAEQRIAAEPGPVPAAERGHDADPAAEFTDPGTASPAAGGNLPDIPGEENSAPEDGVAGTSTATGSDDFETRAGSSSEDGGAGEETGPASFPSQDGAVPHVAVVSVDSRDETDDHAEATVFLGGSGDSVRMGDRPSEPLAVVTASSGLPADSDGLAEATVRLAANAGDHAENDIQRAAATSEPAEASHRLTADRGDRVEGIDRPAEGPAGLTDEASANETGTNAAAANETGTNETGTNETGTNEAAVDETGSAGDAGPGQSAGQAVEIVDGLADGADGAADGPVSDVDRGPAAVGAEVTDGAGHDAAVENVNDPVSDEVGAGPEDASRTVPAGVAAEREDHVPDAEGPDSGAQRVHLDGVTPERDEAEGAAAAVVAARSREVWPEARTEPVRQRRDQRAPADRRRADPEQILASYAWAFDPQTLREQVDDPDRLWDLVDRLTDRLEYAERDNVRAGLLGLRAVVSRVLGELDEAVADGRAGLRHAEASGELRQVSIAQARLAHVLQWRGEFAEADRLFAQADSVELPSRTRAEISELAGRSAFEQGRYLEAVNHFERALDVRRGEDPELVERIELALDAIARRTGNGWGPYPRTRDELLGLPEAPVPLLDDGAGLWGYAAAVEPRYAEAQPFSEGVAWVRRPDSYAWELIDQTGELVIPAAHGYLTVGRFAEGLAWVSRGDDTGWFAIDRQNRLVVAPAGFEDARPFRRGLAVIRQAGVWGAVDRHGRIAVRPRFRRFVTVLHVGGPVDGFTDEGLAVVDAGDRFGVLDRTGQLVLPAVHAAVVIHPSAFLVRDAAGLWGALDRQGEPLVDMGHRDPASVVELLPDEARPVL